MGLNVDPQFVNFLNKKTTTCIDLLHMTSEAQSVPLGKSAKASHRSFELATIFHGYQWVVSAWAQIPDIAPMRCLPLNPRVALSARMRSCAGGLYHRPNKQHKDRHYLVLN